ncbi:hypothetical protein COU01_02840 [Candidatus Falkowbacteria bacterium CG10_big_fil_rev_8_21_14_0_10_44_15]|uniref:HTH arsR-type domain-containing protein n=1 Tax=Candidatus Falkowbacteria bacterium CG10_big_fil_rev_8_21_14_0_10_44_15 TaxID=1974569 RepID=A0A2H0UZI9_9BACT|nr:MAG: hypothetical protein COU01_02840 [Candidatus Falkowbacteria bacterium CG10_big_fil_rev_8_21_14_0_10_44_15]
MLTKLFSSPVRVKILKFLIMHSPVDFSAADIAAKTKSVVRSVNKEMGKLAETGAVVEELKPLAVNKKVVKVKHYRANVDFALFSEIKNLFIKLQVLELDYLRHKLPNIGRLNYAALAGKFVGNATSGVDLLIVGRVDNKKLEKLIADFQAAVGWEINWAVMDLEEYDYRQKIGDMFLYNLLSGKKIELFNKFV